MLELEERQVECRKNCAFNFPVSIFLYMYIAMQNWSGVDVKI